MNEACQPVLLRLSGPEVRKSRTPGLQFAAAMRGMTVSHWLPGCRGAIGLGCRAQGVYPTGGQGLTWAVCVHAANGGAGLPDQRPGHRAGASVQVQFPAAGHQRGRDLKSSAERAGGARQHGPGRPQHQQQRHWGIPEQQPLLQVRAAMSPLSAQCSVSDPVEYRACNITVLDPHPQDGAITETRV